MGPESKEENAEDWGALQSVLATSADEVDDDEPGIDVISNTGLPTSGGNAQTDAKELPYVTLINAAVTMVKAGELSTEDYIAGVKKLEVVADNALKIYAIPAIKKDLPGKLTDDQNAIVSSLEAEIHRLKAGLTLLLSYPDTESVSDLDTGRETAVSAMNAMAEIQKKADAERARIQKDEKEDKARRAQKAAEAEA